MLYRAAKKKKKKPIPRVHAKRFWFDWTRVGFRHERCEAPKVFYVHLGRYQSPKHFVQLIYLEECNIQITEITNGKPKHKLCLSVQLHYVYSHIHLMCACSSHFSHVRLFVTPWTTVYQAPLSMNSPGKNTGVHCHSLLQGIFLTQGSNPCLPHCRRILYRLSHRGNPCITQTTA